MRTRVAALSCLMSLALVEAAAAAERPVEVWGQAELTFTGPREGNPFVEVDLGAEFTFGDKKTGERRVSVRGFYDGDGTYRVRFMPDREGTWRWVTRSNKPELSGRQGTLKVVRATAANHGPVRVRDRFHFAYADGKPYHPFGTTIYALVHQDLALQEQTLRTLGTAPFNKLRLCVFPKWYDYNRNEPPLYPFERGADGKFDLARPHVPFWRLLEQRVAELGKLGIEADLILFHPYDENHWGFDRMGPEADQRILRYIIARLGSQRNVWWSMANEWDFVKHRTVDEWNKLFDVIAAEDPYRHLTSIHNGVKWFDHSRAVITHVSIQHSDTGRMREWRQQYGKPAVDDECMYEGDIEHPWGNITGEELTARHWIGFLRGGYVGHGETFHAADQVLWWSKGGVLKGKSPERIAFLRKLVEACGTVEPTPEGWPFDAEPAARCGDGYLVYFGVHQPVRITQNLTNALARKDTALKAAKWTFELIDTWNMTTTKVPGEHQDKFEIALPAKPYMALRAIPTLQKASPRTAVNP